MRERMKSIRRIHEGDKMQIYEKINKTSWKLFGLDYEQSLLFGEVGRASQKKKILAKTEKMMIARPSSAWLANLKFFCADFCYSCDGLHRIEGTVPSL